MDDHDFQLVIRSRYFQYPSDSMHCQPTPLEKLVLLAWRGRTISILMVVPLPCSTVRRSTTCTQVVWERRNWRLTAVRTFNGMQAAILSRACCNCCRLFNWEFRGLHAVLWGPALLCGSS